MTIGETLELGPGSVVALNRMAGEPVDLLVNGTPIARGEVVVIDEEFGLRVTERRVGRHGRARGLAGRDPGARPWAVIMKRLTIGQTAAMSVGDMARPTATSCALPGGEAVLAPHTGARRPAPGRRRRHLARVPAGDKLVMLRGAMYRA